MKIVPLGENVVVKRFDAEDKTRGGIVLPDSAQQRPQQGRVLSVGDGKVLADGTRAGVQVSEGDCVMFAPYSGAEVSVNGDDLLILSEGDILAIVN
jgi:chaperonin GroES